MSRWNPTPTPEGYRVCYKCKNMLPLTADFFHRKSSVKDKGFNRQCKICTNNYSREYGKGKGNRERLNSQYKTRYGISLAEKEALIQNQNGLCLICQQYMTDPHIDHDHETGRIRGVLCHHCNTALGNFHDSVFHLQRAIDYLQGKLEEDVR